MSKPNNPPAFPSRCEDDFEGMTMRDYFAAAAAAAIYSQVMNNPKDGKSLGADYIAGCAYILADAMLQEREK